MPLQFVHTILCWLDLCILCCSVLQSALKLHHTKFGDRRINVELSCGGGGKTEERTEKIKAKNTRVQRQRIKRRKKKIKTEPNNKTDE